MPARKTPRENGRPGGVLQPRHGYARTIPHCETTTLAPFGNLLCRRGPLTSTTTTESPAQLPNGGFATCSKSQTRSCHRAAAVLRRHSVVVRWPCLSGLGRPGYLDFPQRWVLDLDGS